MQQIISKKKKKLIIKMLFQQPFVPSIDPARTYVVRCHHLTVQPLAYQLYCMPVLEYPETISPKIVIDCYKKKNVSTFIQTYLRS